VAAAHLGVVRRFDGMITIEFEEPTESICECCGNVTVRLTRFVYRDNDAHAVYYAQYTAGHGEKRLSGLIGLGGWGETGSPEQRIAFPFQIRTDEETFKVGLVNAADSPWSHVTFLGRILNREEALKHEWIEEVFHITDHMVADDPEITKYFGAGSA
jgi:hypothetical protein